MNRVKMHLVAVIMLLSCFTLAGISGQSQGSVDLFVTIDLRAPDGKVAVVDQSLGGVRTIARNLDGPRDIVCTADGLFVADFLNKKIVRMDSSGAVKKVVASGQFTPYDFVFAPNGDLFFTTAGVGGGQFTGLWRLRAGADSSQAEQILPATSFPPGTDYLAAPNFLTEGTYKGDLILIANDNDSPADKILRIPAPDFDKVVDFIRTGPNGPFRDPGGMAIDPTGDVYVADFLDGMIMNFDSNGNFKSVYKQILNPLRLRFDSAGSLYLITGASTNRGIHIIPAEGKGSERVIGGILNLRAVAVCE